jgi:SAM-dependent methyltransferase
MAEHTSLEEPSEWVLRCADYIARGPILDVACGGGRHSRFFLRKDLTVVAVDRDDPGLPPGISFVKADLEGGNPWPFAGQRFGGIVVTNYLHRPLFPRLADSLDEGGVLIYETFMAGNERYGRPSNPDFLLRPGELLEAFGNLTVIAFEQGVLERPRAAAVQRICVIRGAAGSVKIPA